MNEIDSANGEDPASFEKQSFCTKVCLLTKAVKRTLYDMPILTVTLFGNMVTKLLAVLFSNYLILWI